MARTEPSVDDAPAGDVMPEVTVPSGWAWGVCWLLFASTVLNYMDRQAVALVGGPIREEFGLSNFDFGWVLAAFQLTYAVAQVPAGFLADRWDLRRTYAGAVAWWSLAGLLSAFSPGLGVLLVFRALLGVGESFNWPCALRATARVLPPADRSLGNGIFNSGAAVGAVVTPLVVPLLADRFGWRTAFVAIGVLGFAWVAAWLFVFRGDRRRWLAAPKRFEPADEFGRRGPGLSVAGWRAFGGVGAVAVVIALIGFRVGLQAVWWSIAWLMFGTLAAARALPPSAMKGASWAEDLSTVVRLRRFWVLVVTSVSINVCWHFLVNWLPTYLRTDRGMTFLASGLLSALPFLAADAGGLGGGALSRWLSRRGLEPSRARRLVMAGCTLLVAAGAGVGAAGSDAVVITLLGVMALGTAGFMANYFAFTQDVSPRHTGLIVGLLGGLGNLAAAGFLPLAGWVKDTTGGFGPVFALVGVLPFLGLAALAVGWGRDGGATPGPAGNPA